MAKLVAIVYRAVWFVVALAAIVRSTQADGLFSSSPSSKDKRPHERNGKDWKKLGAACVKSVPKSESNLDMITFLSELKVVSKETDCSEEFRDRIVHYLYITSTTVTIIRTNALTRPVRFKRSYEECFKLMKEYLTLYLDKCGCEESFRKAADFIEEKSHQGFSFTQHETLKSFIEEAYWDSGVNPRSLGSLLEDIEKISKLERIFGETDCTEELTTEMIALFVSSNDRSYYPVQEFRKVNFAIYMDKCGYEKLHNKRIEHMKQGSDEHWNSDEYPTLYSYFAAILLANKSKDDTMLIRWLTGTLRMMRELSDLGSVSNETQCPEMLNGAPLTEIEYSSGEQLLYELYKDYFTLYLDKCGLGRRFKKVIENISHEYWDSKQCPTLRSYLVAEFWPQIANNQGMAFELNKLIAVIEQLSEFNDIPKETYCTEQAKNKLLLLRDETRTFPKLRELVNGHFALYLNECGVDERLKNQAEDKERE